ncbi:UNVERIFIED_CONTAM: hypothetical protein Sangu_2328400 [Sesamum angustifolium]|uniref:EF-hand domain-containing protein n=1 Tax=Sesamum angustifolium TaxID=2727405 RepID=A0AAW2L6X0_9LAMI
MAGDIIPRIASSDGKVELSMEEFKKWLMQFDRDRDGRINMEELRQAIYDTGGWLCRWKARRAMKNADTTPIESSMTMRSASLCRLRKSSSALRSSPFRFPNVVWSCYAENN